MSERVQRAARGCCLAAVLIAASLSVSARAGQTGDPGRFQPAGVTAEAAERFFQRVRAAVGLNDRPGACALVAYPLARAEGTIANAAACEAAYDEVFTLDVRKAIGKQVFEEVFVNERGIMVGNGEVWIARRCGNPPCGPADLRIVSITGSAANLIPPKGKVMLACRAAGQRLQVSADGDGGAELRIWRSGRTTDAASTVVERALESTRDDRCGAGAWTFVDGSTRFIVGNLACDAHLSPPPMGSVGRLVVKREGTEDVEFWCAE